MKYLYQLTALSLLSLPLFADENANQMIQFEQRLSALEEKAHDSKIYNSSARPHVADSYHVYITGSGLFWKPSENGLEYVVKTNDPFLTGSNDKQTLKSLHFDYDIGFRVGLGFNLPHDAWDLFLNWTRFYTDASGHTHANSDDGLLPIWSSLLDGSQDPFQHAHSHWRLRMDMIDGEIGREYYIGKWVSLRPSLGVRTVWIKQHDNIRYDHFFNTALEEDRIRLVNDFSGIGPKAAIDSTWDLCWGFSLYGAGSLSLLYGEFEIRSHEHLTATVSKKNSFHDDFHLIRALADLQVGIGWDILFFHDRFHFGIRACWEQMLFFGQNQLYRLVNSDFKGSYVSNLGDLSFQGGTLSVRLDF